MSRSPSLPLALVLGIAACTSTPEKERWYEPLGFESPRPRPAPTSSRSAGRSLDSPMVTRIYDVSDLTFGFPSFAGPEIGDLRRVDERPDYAWPPVLERTSRYREDELLELIQRSIAPDTWDEDGVSITIENGRLIVRHRG